MNNYKFYLDASSYFINCQDKNNLNDKETEYFNISSLLLSWIALETFINSVSETFSKGTRLKNNEISFLNEKELKVNDDGVFEEVRIKPSTTKKILFLMHNFTKKDTKEFKQEILWNKIKAFEELRDKIVHNKNKHQFTITQKKAIECRDIAKESITYLSKLLKN